MTEPADSEADIAFKLVDGLDKMVAAAAGLKQQCLDRGFSPESGETVAVELLVGLIRAATTARRGGLLEALAKARR